MVRAVPHSQPRSQSRNRFSLRTLFLVSAAIAVPFWLLANMRHTTRPEDSVASPLYLILGGLAVFLAAGIGNALGRRAGTYVAAGLAALCWIALVFVCSDFSKELKAVLPVHVLGALAAVGIVALVLRCSHEPELEGPDAALARLLKVKSDVRDSRQVRKRSTPHPDGTGSP